MPLLCCDGCDTIEGRCGGGVKDLRPRFTHTDIRAGQRHLDDRHASLRCRHWERSREGIHRRRVASTGPGPTAWWSLVIDSARQACATRPLPIRPATPARRFPTVHMSPYPRPPPRLPISPRRLQGRRHTPIGRACPPSPRPLPHPGRPHPHAEPSSSPTTFRPAANADGDIPHGRARLAAARGIRRRRGQQSRPPTRETSPAAR